MAIRGLSWSKRGEGESCRHRQDINNITMAENKPPFVVSYHLSAWKWQKKKKKRNLLCILRLEKCRNHAALKNIQGNRHLPNICYCHKLVFLPALCLLYQRFCWQNGKIQENEWQEKKKKNRSNFSFPFLKINEGWSYPQTERVGFNRKSTDKMPVNVYSVTLGWGFPKWLVSKILLT